MLEFYLPAGRIGGDLGAFFALCDSDEEEDKAQIPTSEFSDWEFFVSFRFVEFIFYFYYDCGE